MDINVCFSWNNNQDDDENNDDYGYSINGEDSDS